MEPGIPEIILVTRWGNKDKEKRSHTKNKWAERLDHGLLMALLSHCTGSEMSILRLIAAESKCISYFLVYLLVDFPLFAAKCIPNSHRGVAFSMKISLGYYRHRLLKIKNNDGIYEL